MNSATQEALTDTQVASQAVTTDGLADLGLSLPTPSAGGESVPATAEPGVMSPIESDFHRTLALGSVLAEFQPVALHVDLVFVPEALGARRVGRQRRAD